MCDCCFPTFLWQDYLTGSDKTCTLGPGPPGKPGGPAAPKGPWIKEEKQSWCKEFSDVNSVSRLFLWLEIRSIYSQLGQQVQHCHQNHEHQKDQQGRGDLSHRADHVVPEDRTSNRVSQNPSWWKHLQEYKMKNIEFYCELTASPELPGDPEAPDSPYRRVRKTKTHYICNYMLTYEVDKHK